MTLAGLCDLDHVGTKFRSNSSGTVKSPNIFQAVAQTPQTPKAISWIYIYIHVSRNLIHFKIFANGLEVLVLTRYNEATENVAILFTGCPYYDSF